MNRLDFTSITSEQGITKLRAMIPIGYELKAGEVFDVRIQEYTVEGIKGSKFVVVLDMFSRAFKGQDFPSDQICITKLSMGPMLLTIHFRPDKHSGTLRSAKQTMKILLPYLIQPKTNIFNPYSGKAAKELFND